MENQLLKNETYGARLEALKATAEKVEKFTYPKALAPDEVVKMREDFTANAIKKSKLDEARAEYLTEYKAQVKPLLNQMGYQMQIIRNQVEEITEDVFFIADQEAGQMGYYNALGELVHQRPLMQDEKQMRMVSSDQHLNAY